MDRIPILKLGSALLVTVQVDMHDRLAMPTTTVSASRMRDTAAMLSSIRPMKLSTISSAEISINTPLAPKATILLVRSSSRAVDFRRWRRPAGNADRRSESRADSAQPDFQRAEIYRERRGPRHRALRAGENNSLSFMVRDTGIGIAAKDLERIFEEFSQVESALQRKVKGTGLGLPLSRSLAELIGGTIAVRKRAGQGSVFTLTDPGPYLAPARRLRRRPRSFAQAGADHRRR